MKENKEINQYSICLLEITQNLILTILLIFYDLNYYELLNLGNTANGSNDSNYNYKKGNSTGEIETGNSFPVAMFSNKNLIVGNNSKGNLQLNLTEKRLESIFQIFGNNSSFQDNYLYVKELISNLANSYSSLNNIFCSIINVSYIENLKLEPARILNKQVGDNLNLLQEIIDKKAWSKVSIQEGLDDKAIHHSSSSKSLIIKLPNARKINDKVTIIRKYYEFKTGQSPTAESNLFINSINNSSNNHNIQHKSK